MQPQIQSKLQLKPEFELRRSYLTLKRIAEQKPEPKPEAKPKMQPQMQPLQRKDEEWLYAHMLANRCACNCDKLFKKLSASIDALSEKLDKIYTELKMRDNDVAGFSRFSEFDTDECEYFTDVFRLAKSSSESDDAKEFAQRYIDELNKRIELEKGANI